jgi:NAD(P)H dehydrogenase (quinone)
MIVITGASGQLGQLVITELLKKAEASNIVAAVRDPARATHLAALGVQVREADYDQPASLDAAFQGASKVLLISSNALGRRVAQHKNVIDAAVRAGVSLLAYTSVLRADTSTLSVAVEHLATEEAIRASGLPFSFLRNGWYLENYTEHLAPALAHGALLGSAGEGRIAAAARADYAAAAAAVLTQLAPAPVHELAGERAFTMAELAQAVGAQAGKEIVYRDLPRDEYRAILASVGLPAEMADLLADSDVAARGGALEGEGAVLRGLVGRSLVTLEEAIGKGLSSAH